MLRVSRKSDNETTMAGTTRRSQRTWVPFKALARYVSAPSPISFREILSIVRLCEWRGTNCDELSSQKRHALTRLIFNASARYSTAGFPIPFASTSNFVRVCAESKRALVVVAGYVKKTSYLIHFQGISKVKNTFITNLIVPQPQICECLQTMFRWREERKMLSYLIDFQCITDLFNSFITDTVPSKIQ